jgi:tetratricopeptide (TPR) repeat protein
MTTRLEKIKAMLQDDPKDTFLRYSLAMEYASHGQEQEALTAFTELTKDKSPHVPAFFQAAQLLARLQRYDESRTYLRDGIEEARTQGDTHAAGEMAEFLAQLGQQGE